MFTKYRFLGALIAGVGLLLGTTGDAFAQRGRGASRGSRGTVTRSYNGGGSNYSRGGYGGYGEYGRGGYGGFGYGRGYGYGGWGGWGWGPGWGWYGGYGPYYGGYSGYADPGAANYDNTVPVVPAPSTMAAPQAVDNDAHIRVIVPDPNAQVFFNGALTQQTGPDRFFETPALSPGNNYTYTIRANWTQNGQPMSKERTLNVTAGQWSVVDFRQ